MGRLIWALLNWSAFWMCFIVLYNLILCQWVESNEEDLSMWSDDLWVVSLYQAVNYTSLTSTVYNNNVCFFKNESEISIVRDCLLYDSDAEHSEEMNNELNKTSVCCCCCNSDYGLCLNNTRLWLLLIWWYYWVIWSNGIDISCIRLCIILLRIIILIKEVY